MKHRSISQHSISAGMVLKFNMFFMGETWLQWSAEGFDSVMLTKWDKVRDMQLSAVYAQ